MLRKHSSISRPTWLYVSGIAFIFSLATAILFIIYQVEITKEWINRSIFYILLFPIGFSAAAFLFGALRSHARYVGKTSYGNLELAGPVVIFCLVIVGGWFFTKPTDNFTLTIRVQKADNADEIIKVGSVLLDLLPQRSVQPINQHGEAIFTELPSKYIGETVRIIPQVEGLELKDQNTFKIPEDGEIILNLVERTDSTLIRGTVFSAAGEPLRDALLNFDSGSALGKSDENGNFNIKVPGKPGATSLLVVTLNGKLAYQEYVSLPGNAPLVIKLY